MDDQAARTVASSASVSMPESEYISLPSGALRDSGLE